MKVPSVLTIVILGLASFCFADEVQKSSESLGLSDLSSKEAETLLLFIQGVIQAGYSEDKYGTISELVQAFQEDLDTTNITLVGTQNVYNEDGSFKEVRTIELAIPTVQQKSVIDLNLNSDNNEDEDFDSEDYEQMREARDMIEKLSLLGLNMEISYVELDKEGNVEEELFVSPKILAIQDSGIIYINKTIKVDTIDDVTASYKTISEASRNLTSYLSYDTEGKFIKEKSIVIPEMFASIDSDYENPDNEKLAVSLELLVNTVLESGNKDDVPETLRQALEHHYPEYMFSIMEGEPVGAYMNKDFSIHLSYDFVDFEDSWYYSIYGYKNSKSDTM